MARGRAAGKEPAQGRGRGRTAGKGPPDSGADRTPPDLGGGDNPHPRTTNRVAGSWQKRELILPHPRGRRWLLYGHQKVAGKIQFTRLIQGGGSNRGDLWVVIELCAGECDALIDVHGVGGSLASYFQYWWYPGTSAGQIDPNFQAIYPGWNEQFAGTCYVVCRFRKFTTVWDGRLPANLLWEMRTRKPLNPDTLTHVYSTNPFDQWYDFLRWDEGKKRPASRINTASFVTAKAIANETFGAPLRKRFESHMSVMDEVSPDDVIEAFRLITDSFWFDQEGRVLVDRPGAAAATYGDQHVSRRVAIAGERTDPFERPNVVRLWYTDVANDWKRTLVEVKSAAVIAGTEDPIETEYEVPWIHDEGMARSRGVYILNCHQFDLKLKERWLMSTADRQLGDIVTRDIPSRGLVYTGRLLRRRKNPDNTFEVELHEYNAAKYSDDVLAAGVKTPSTLPSAGDTPADVDLATVTITEELWQEQAGEWKTRGKIVLTNPDTDFFSHLEIWLSIAGGEYRFIGKAPNGAGAVVIAHTPAITEVEKTYTFKFISVSKFDIKSAGVTKAKDFTGKVAAPSQPVNLTATQRGRMIHLAWLPSSDKDAVEYEIRRGSTTDTWSTMARIAKTRSQEWFDEPPIGTFRYEVRSTDGIRYSDFGASSTATVFFFGPAGDVEEGTKAFYVDVDTFDMELHGDTWMGAPLSVKSPLVIEGVKTGKMTFLLANNSVGSIFGAPADADAFIASANLDSVQEYEDLWHAPFRKGPDGVVQPLWAPIQGSLVQSIFSNEVWGGDGLGYRNANFKFRLNGQTLRVGYDSPEVHTRIEVKNEFSGDVGVEVTDPEGLDASLGIELATSIGGTFSQTLFKCDKATAFGWKREQHVASIVPPTDYTTDSNGHAIVTYPEPMQPGQVPHLTVQVLNGVSATWTIESLDHATAVVRARNPSTGATLAGVVLRISADDHGGGGSTYQLAAADDPNPLP